MILCPICRSTYTLPEYRFVCGSPQDTYSCLDCGHVWLSGSQYGPATEEPEEEA